MNASRHMSRNRVLGPATVAAVLLVAVPAAAGADPPDRPAAGSRVAAQLHVWSQYYAEKHGRLEDHLDDVFAAVRRAGFDAVQGWLSYYDTPEAAADVAARLKAYGLTMPAAYAGGAMHTRPDGERTIREIIRQAKLGVPHGLRIVVHNPQPLGREKTDEELAVQAENLDRLGAALNEIGVRLAVHSHDPEMRSGAREWYSILLQTDPQKVGICLDLDWVLRGGQDPYRLLENAAPRVLDLHLRSCRQGVWSENLGDGDIDYARVRGILQRMDYRGWYTVELAYEAGTRRTRPLEEDLRLSREYVRCLLGQ
jgi:inosose dehydratase